MFPYWLLFAYFACGALFSQPQRGPHRRISPLMFAGFVLIVVMVGLRYQVGADWGSYRLIFSFAGYADLVRAISLGDPGYQILNWTVRNLGGEFWVVNLIAAAIFSWGLLRFVRVQPYPWLAVVIAIPYLVIVVAMGYTRQAIAIGVLMAGLAAVQCGASTLRFAFYVGVAALFHKTAVFVLPLVVFSSERNRLVNILGGVIATYMIYNSFLADSVDNLVRNYIVAEYSSQGATTRVAMNLVPAAIYFLFWRYFGFSDREKRLWFFHSVAAVGFLVLLLVLPSSTAVDRLALYVLPLQIAILARMPIALGPRAGTILVILYSLSVQFVWLNFATHAKYWVPYRFYPLQGF